MSKLLNSVAFAAAAGLAVIAASPAEAKCTRLGFSVNDYGKDGPTSDAKKLLDKHIADWATQQGIAKYTVGKKDVKCELFLDFIVFDEHTCRAEADVCWGDGGSSSKKPQTADAEEGASPKRAVKPAKAAKAAPAGETQADAPNKDAAAAPAAPAATAKKAAAPAAAADAKPAEAPAERKVVYPATLRSDAAPAAPTSTVAKPSAITTGTIDKAAPEAKKPAGE